MKAFSTISLVLATSPEDKLRDGKRAVELATKAAEVSDFQTPHVLSTLAAAYAETGDFDTAKKWSAKSIELSQKELDSAETDADASHPNRKSPTGKRAGHV